MNTDTNTHVRTRLYQVAFLYSSLGKRVAMQRWRELAHCDADGMGQELVAGAGGCRKRKVRLENRLVSAKVTEPCIPRLKRYAYVCVSMHVLTQTNA